MPFIVASANTRINISDHPTVVNTFNMVIKWYAIYLPTTCEYIVLFWGVTVNTSLRILSSPYVIQFYTFSGRYVPLQVLVENSCTIIFPSICNMYMDVSLWHRDTYIVVNPDLHIWWQNTLWYVKLYKFQSRIIKQKCPIWIILLPLIIANTRQIPLYQFMICWTQNFISITVNLYKRT